MICPLDNHPCSMPDRGTSCRNDCLEQAKIRVKTMVNNAKKNVESVYLINEKKEN